jgi:D-lyxose ketol-isomerase
MNDKVKNIIINEFKKLILKFEINVFIKIKINNIQQQDINSSNCGWFSMYFLIMRFNNYTFKYITKFNDVKEDEKHIELLKDKYDKFGFI